MRRSMAEEQLVRVYEFFKAVAEPLQPGRKTVDFQIVNMRSGALIGMVRWYGPWRQYVLFPEPMTVWSKGCLADIQDVITIGNALRAKLADA